MADEATQEEKKTEATPLKSVTSLTKDRDQAIVEKLKEFIKLAEEGHLSDLVIIGKVRGEPLTEIDWETDNPLELLGALELAKQDVSEDILSAAEGDEDDDEDDD